MNTKDTNGNGSYTCPMHPNIKSDKPGKCSECGMALIKRGSTDTSTHENHSVQKLEKNKSREKSMLYTCPMDPEIVRHEPGECPKCGMKLEPKKANNEHEDHGGHKGMEQDFKRRFLIALPLTAIILSLSPQIQKWAGYSIDFPGINIIIFLIASVMVFYNGWPFYVMAKGEIKTRAYGMMTLVSLAVLSGYIFSVAATFLFEGENLYWEISTLVLAFLFGHWIEMRAVRGATGALSELAKLIPPKANLLRGKEVITVGTEELEKGNKILVRPGEKVPIDGMVVDGESSVNESMITGESRPIAKKKGSEVIGGTINNDGSLTIEVTKTGDETAVSQMIELVRSAQESKPPVQKLADRAAKYLTFIAIAVGLATLIFWLFINPQGAVFASTLAITVIVIACPHALGLAIPIVTTITTSIAAKNGILIKDMKGMEIARKIDYVVFDKTGTLTEGKFGVSKIVKLSSESEDEILALASAVEISSQHSIAQGIVQEAKKRNLSMQSANNFTSFPGKGAKGIVDGSEILIGNKILLNEDGIGLEKLNEKISIDEIATSIYVSKDKELIGIILLEDIIREESREAIKSLKKMGVKTAMLTGDNDKIAKSVANKLGIDTFFAEVLPEEKVSKIKELQEKGNIVAMVGDGVNDAPSLAQSHVGIAIGAGTDVAVESAEIVLVKNDPRDVVKAIKLSQKTNSKMKQNLVWAAGYNLIAMPMAAGVLFPIGILLRPEWSALIMSASSVIVVSNALLLRKETLT
ncbi:cadmium-translocating P-type ATPase [Patescibacteria group bacterium]|nr:cadmium-translocating P-type ATPase [Patescibacteria group bacterium]